jgi:hypothetical protein
MIYRVRVIFCNNQERENLTVKADSLHQAIALAYSAVGDLPDQSYRIEVCDSEMILAEITIRKYGR